eukprot:338379-Alexandrium_andersonii.AAC.1
MERVISTAGQKHQPEGECYTAQGVRDIGVHIEECSGAGHKPAVRRIFIQLFTGGIQHFPEPAKLGN